MKSNRTVIVSIGLDAKPKRKDKIEPKEDGVVRGGRAHAGDDD